MSPRLTAVSLVAGAGLTVAGMAATPWESEPTTAQDMAGAAAFGAAAVLPAFLGLILLLVAAARARLVATWVPALYLVGILVSFGGLGVLTIAGSVISGTALVLTARGVLAAARPASAKAPAAARPAVPVEVATS